MRQITIALLGAFGSATGKGIEPPAAMDERGEGMVNGKVRVSSQISDQIVVAAGATGPRIATTTEAAVNIGQVVALRPLP